MSIKDFERLQARRSADAEAQRLVRAIELEVDRAAIRPFWPEIQQARKERDGRIMRLRGMDD